ncbi:sensor kinase DpiB, partial [Salmonella enterica subsp. enterica serovar Heidelberg str. 640151-11]
YCARRFSLHIKKQMLNMEPQQLSQLLIQQSVLFESVFEGLIAIDSHHRITAINQTARRLLNLSQPESGSVSVVSARIIGGWINGTSAIYEYAATAMAPSSSGASLPDR